MTWWQLLVTILVVGVLIELVRRFAAPWIDPLVLKIFYAVAIIMLVLFILYAFGLLPLAVATAPVPKVR